MVTVKPCDFVGNTWKAMSRTTSEQIWKDNAFCQNPRKGI